VPCPVIRKTLKALEVKGSCPACVLDKRKHHAGAEMGFSFQVQIWTVFREVSQKNSIRGRATPPGRLKRGEGGGVQWKLQLEVYLLLSEVQASMVRSSASWYSGKAEKSISGHPCNLNTINMGEALYSSERQL